MTPRPKNSTTVIRWTILLAAISAVGGCGSISIPIGRPDKPETAASTTDPINKDFAPARQGFARVGARAGRSHQTF